MRAVVQRVRRACVRCEGETVSSIGCGAVVLLGVARGDRESQALEMARKTVELRVFEDEAGKMNLSLLDVGGEMLVVSQFTLCADTSKGRRPSFAEAAPAEEAKGLYLAFADAARARGVVVKEGVFGGRMDVELVNDGPVTVILEVRPDGE